MSALAEKSKNGVGAETVSPLLRCARLKLPANITAVAFDKKDKSSFAAALGNGSIVIGTVALSATNPTTMDVSPPDAHHGEEIKSQTLQAHRVAAVAVSPLAEKFVTAGQDGRLFIFEPTESTDTGWTERELFSTGGPWIEALTTHSDSGLIACAYANTVTIFDSDGQMISSVELDHTVTDISFDSEGKRVAASHYNGVSLLQVGKDQCEPTSFYWKGAHISLSWSTDDRYIVTGTQDREIHAWDLVTMQDFRMGGYPRKVRSFDWISNKEMLVCSGADVVTAWSFAGAGPGRKPPLEIGFAFGETVTAVAAHPSQAYAASGFSAGNIQIGATGKGEALVAQVSTGHAVTALDWSSDGKLLIAADNSGGLSAFAMPEDLGVR